MKINYQKWIAFKNLLFLTHLISFITIMESHSCKTFITKFEWISKWETWPPSVRMNFDSLLAWIITDAVCSAMQSMISWWVSFFLSLFITFITNVRMSIIPSPYLFFFALRLEWSLNLNTDGKIKCNLYICELVFHFI